MSINEYDQWLGVELRHLAALEAVAQEGSFGRAARRLGYTQSAVSQQIAQLERIVGAKLIERPGGPRAVSLTDAGRLLRRHADAIVARLAAAQPDMAAPPFRELAPLPLIGWRSGREQEIPGVEYAFRSDDNGTVLGLVEAGIGVAVAPRLVLDPGHEGIVALPFGSRRPPRLLALAW